MRNYASETWILVMIRCTFEAVNFLTYCLFPFCCGLIFGRNELNLNRHKEKLYSFVYKKLIHTLKTFKSLNLLLDFWGWKIYLFLKYKI